MKAVVIAVNGILTPTNAPSWPDYLDAFLEDCKVERRDYFAGPFPIWNVFVKNRYLAHELAAEITLVADRWPTLPINFVAHSNGSDIALKAINLLARQGLKVSTAILVGSVTDPDVERSGVRKLIHAGMLGRAFAYCGDRDRALGIPLKWPYRNLGICGWQLDGKSYIEPRITTRQFKGYGHSDYFVPWNREKTFAQMRADMEL